MHVDPISDMLTRIRNANASGKDTVIVPYSKLKENVLKVIKENGFISSYNVKKQWKFNVLDVSFSKVKKISGLKKVSKLWCRVFRKWAEIKPVLRWFWISIMSTSEGVIAWHKAFKKWIWWEVLCEIY